MCVYPISEFLFCFVRGVVSLLAMIWSGMMLGGCYWVGVNGMCGWNRIMVGFSVFFMRLS